MNDWVCTIRTPSNFLQTIEVEAYDRFDAVSMAESSTGGKCIQANIQGPGSYQNSADSSNGNAELSPATILFGLICLIFIFAWKWILLIGGISLIVWVAYLITNDN